MTMMGNVEECKVDLKLPKFITEMELPLNDIISQLGAPSIFNPSKADFSRFAKGDFFVSQMLQKAKIEVSEKGTEAAAVTRAIMVASLGPREERSVVSMLIVRLSIRLPTNRPAPSSSWDSLPENKIRKLHEK